MTDLHTHILPGMDDGAKDILSARTLLEKEYLQGVRNVALTSHFHCEGESVDDFLLRRERSFTELSASVPEGMSLKLGSEVFFSPQLVSFEVERLCLEGTNVLLLELPVLRKPVFVKEVLSNLRSRGIVPMLAHVERYLYVQDDPAILMEWRKLGALIQVNARSLMDKGSAMKLIKWGFADVIASDTHSTQHRPPDLRRGLDAVAKALGAEKAMELERNAARIFSGRDVPKRFVHMPKRIFGVWI